MPPAQTPALGCFPKKGHLGSPLCQSNTHFLQVGVTGAFTGQRKGVLGRGVPEVGSGYWDLPDHPNKTGATSP